nr:unnamed protein product [Callosobruchus analis]
MHISDTILPLRYTYLFRRAYFCSGFHRLVIFLLVVELVTRISASNQIMEHAIFDNEKCISLVEPNPCMHSSIPIT